MDRRAFIGTWPAASSPRRSPPRRSRRGRSPRLGFLDVDPVRRRSSRLARVLPRTARPRLRGWAEHHHRLPLRGEARPSGFPPSPPTCLRVKATSSLQPATPAARPRRTHHTIPDRHALRSATLWRAGSSPASPDPGGNITGTVPDAPGACGKRLELLKEIVPDSRACSCSRIPAIPIAAPQLKELEVAAHALGVNSAGPRHPRPPMTFRLRSTLEPGSAPSGLLTTADCIFVDSANRDRRPRGPAQTAGNVPVQADGRCRRSDGLWREYRLIMYRRARRLRGQDPQGRQARRPARRAADEVRAGHQPQDRQGPRPDDPAVAPAAGGSGDRVMDRRAFIGTLAGGLLAAPLAAEAQPAAKI